MNHWRGFFSVIVMWSLFAGSLGLGAQALRPLPCPPESDAAFKFLVGDWHGVVYELKGTDSTGSGVSARVSAEKVLNGCALLERWHFFDKDGQPEIDGVISAPSMRRRANGATTSRRIGTSTSPIRVSSSMGSGASSTSFPVRTL